MAGEPKVQPRRSMPLYPSSTLTPVTFRQKSSEANNSSGFVIRTVQGSPLAPRDFAQRICRTAMASAGIAIHELRLSSSPPVYRRA